ncbi:MAG: anaerobic ribonucleoside-triphosphate reductase activating protein [Anaerolineae bacterium]|nr:anaerobic ribonucleoside-triphosphate reductase activating protein [Anaerolineae bacterium]
MILGGLQKFSLVDYPGKTCAILFTRGCNFRCPYCHNPELVWPEQYAPEISLEGVLDFLRQRRGLLEAVTLTGGEPTLQADLPAVARAIKEMGFALKLDSNGSRPDRLRELIEAGLVDYVAMDVKAPLSQYARVCGADVSVEPIYESIALLLRGRVAYEFRTTVDRALLSEADLFEIGKMIRGAEKFFLQKLNDFNAKDPQSKPKRKDDAWLRQAAEKLKQYVKVCEVR